MKWKSILQDDPSCSYTGRAGILHKHHIFHGPNRKLAEKDGLYVMLTIDEHRALHDKGVMDDELKKIAQKRWQEYYGRSVEDFIARYGKNYGG